MNLKPERVKRGEEDQAESAEEEPSRPDVRRARREPSRQQRLGRLLREISEHHSIVHTAPRITTYRT